MHICTAEVNTKFYACSILYADHVFVCCSVAVALLLMEEAAEFFTSLPLETLMLLIRYAFCTHTHTNYFHTWLHVLRKGQ